MINLSKLAGDFSFQFSLLFLVYQLDIHIHFHSFALLSFLLILIKRQILLIAGMIQENNFTKIVFLNYFNFEYYIKSFYICIGSMV